MSMAQREEAGAAWPQTLDGQCSRPSIRDTRLAIACEEDRSVEIDVIAQLPEQKRGAIASEVPAMQPTITDKPRFANPRGKVERARQATAFVELEVDDVITARDGGQVAEILKRFVGRERTGQSIASRQAASAPIANGCSSMRTSSCCSTGSIVSKRARPALFASTASGIPGARYGWRRGARRRRCRRA